MILNIGSRFHRPRGPSVPQAVPVLSRLFIPQPTCWLEAGSGAGRRLPRGSGPSDSGAKCGADPWELPTAVQGSLFLLGWRFESTARASARAVPSGVAWGLRVALSPLQLQQPPGRQSPCLCHPFAPVHLVLLGLCRSVPPASWDLARCCPPPPAALCHQRCHPCCWPRCTSRPRAVPGSPVPLLGTFPPVSVTSASERPRIADSGERSSCPLLYLLHLPNLMTGGMRSISNMASFAGSGQSTQEAFLHTPIPACSAAPVPSSPGHPAAACPCRGARRGAQRGWWPWGPLRAPGSG